MSDGQLVYRVRNWDAVHETKASLRRAGSLASVKVSATLGKLAEQKLWLLPAGAAAYGIWIVILRVAATCTRRGLLADDGVPLVAQDFTALTGIPASQIEDAFQVLSSPEIRLLEQVPLEMALRPRESSTEKFEGRSDVAHDLKVSPGNEPGRGRGHDSSELADQYRTDGTPSPRPIPKNRRPDAATNPKANSFPAYPCAPLPPPASPAVWPSSLYDLDGEFLLQKVQELERFAKQQPVLK